MKNYSYRTEEPCIGWVVRYIRFHARAATDLALGPGNPEGDPQTQTLALLEGRTVLRTDQRGTIGSATDGKHFWAESER